MRIAVVIAVLCGCTSSIDTHRWVVRGQRVEWQQETSAGYAEAVLDRRRPRIRLGLRFVELSPVVRDFVLRHEFCHLDSMSDDELAADRCAVMMMDADRLLLASDVAAIALWVAGHDDENHPAGALRAAVVVMAGVR